MDGILTRPILGTDEATIDSKGRVLLSSKKRERLRGCFAMAFSPSGCLAAYPQEVFAAKLKEIFSHSSISLGRDMYTRLFLGTADDDLNWDGQGRVVIPAKLRELAGLNPPKDADGNVTEEPRKVKIIGCGDRLEIWDVDEYEAYEKDPQGYQAERRARVEEAYRLMVGE